MNTDSSLTDQSPIKTGEGVVGTTSTSSDFSKGF